MHDMTSQSFQGDIGTKVRLNLWYCIRQCHAYEYYYYYNTYWTIANNIEHKLRYPSTTSMEPLSVSVVIQRSIDKCV